MWLRALLPHPEQVYPVYLRYQDRNTPRTGSHLGCTGDLDLRNGRTAFSEPVGFASRSLVVGTGVESRAMPGAPAVVARPWPPVGVCRYRRSSHTFNLSQRSDSSRPTRSSTRSLKGTRCLTP